MHYRPGTICVPVRYVDKLVGKAVDEIVDKWTNCG
jgi:hypothetical protein